MRIDLIENVLEEAELEYITTGEAIFVRATALNKAALLRQPIQQYAPNSKPSVETNCLTSEILERIDNG